MNQKKKNEGNFNQVFTLTEKEPRFQHFYHNQDRRVVARELDRVERAINNPNHKSLAELRSFLSSEEKFEKRSESSFSEAEGEGEYVERLRKKVRD